MRFFWNGEFYIVARFQVNCVEAKKDEWRWAFFDVTYAHRDEPRYLPFIMKSYGNATASREETTLLIAETVTHN